METAANYPLHFPGTKRPVAFLRQDNHGEQARDLQDLSKQTLGQLQTQLAAKLQMLENTSLVDRLPDKGDKIRAKVAEIRQVIKKKEDEAAQRELEQAFEKSMRIEDEKEEDERKKKKKDEELPRVVYVKGKPLTIVPEKKIARVSIEELAEIHDRSLREQKEYMFGIDRQERTGEDFDFVDYDDEEDEEDLIDDEADEDDEEEGKDPRDLDNVD